MTTQVKAGEGCSILAKDWRVAVRKGGGLPGGLSVTHEEEVRHLPHEAEQKLFSDCPSIQRKCGFSQRRMDRG